MSDPVVYRSKHAAKTSRVLTISHRRERHVHNRQKQRPEKIYLKQCLEKFYNKPICRLGVSGIYAPWVAGRFPNTPHVRRSSTGGLEKSLPARNQ